MNKYDLAAKIEKIAPLDTQEPWDASGWIVDNKLSEVKKVLFALTITDKVVQQAKDNNCDMIISHHPLFLVPLEYKNINMYCAHTNLDKAEGGTTDTLIKLLGLQGENYGEFVRIVDLDEEIEVEKFKSKLLKISPKLRLINNNDTQAIKTIGFCAGSGFEFADSTPCDAFVTGDVKFHGALEANKVIFDIGHFESEIGIVDVLMKICGLENNGVKAYEKSPFM